MRTRLAERFPLEVRKRNASLQLPQMSPCPCPVLVSAVCIRLPVHPWRTQEFYAAKLKLDPKGVLGNQLTNTLFQPK